MLKDYDVCSRCKSSDRAAGGSPYSRIPGAALVGYKPRIQSSATTCEDLPPSVTPHHVCPVVTSHASMIASTVM